MKYLTVLAIYISASRLGASEDAITSAMTGHWQGSARIIVSWCRQTNLPIALHIDSDGGVTGKIGDATLVNASLKRNRGRLGRKLNVKTDYIIAGNLSGQIVAAEKITRSSVKMPVNFRGGTFVGGVHTSGSKIGGTKRMILSAASLTLNRTTNVTASLDATARQSKPALLLIGNKSDDTLSFVDVRTLNEVAKTTTGRGPHEVVVTPDGKNAFVSNYEGPGDTISAWT